MGERVKRGRRSVISPESWDRPNGSQAPALSADLQPDGIGQNAQVGTCHAVQSYADLT